MTISRRQFIQAGSAAAVSSATLAWALPALGKVDDVPVLMKEAEDLYRRSIVIDMLSHETADAEGLRYIKESGVTGMSFTLGNRWPESVEGAHFTNAFPMAAGIYDCVQWKRFIKANSATLAQALTAADIRRAKQEGKNAIMMNFQQVPIEGRLENVDMFYALGVRVMQITYNERSLLGDGSTERTNAGLSDLGIAVVERMGELGMLVDSSHSGYQTTMDAIAYSKRTPIFSHTNCAALNKHPRNKSDEQIRALAAKGGVMGLTTVGPMVKRDLPTNLDSFLDHVDHIRKLVGVDHVGWGSDCEVRGWPTDPALKDTFLRNYGEPYFKSSYNFRYPLGTEGLNDQHKWKYATAGLIRRGYKEEEIVKVLGGNWMRVIAEGIG